MNSSLEKTKDYISIKNKEIEEKTNFTLAIRDKNNQQIASLIIIKKIERNHKLQFHSAKIQTFSRTIITILSKKDLNRLP